MIGLIITGVLFAWLAWLVNREYRIRYLERQLADLRSGLRYAIEQLNAEHNRFQESEKERKWLKNKALRKEVENHRALEDRTAMYNSLCSLLDTLYLAPVERCKTKLERRLVKVLFHIDQQIHGEGLE